MEKSENSQLKLCLEDIFTVLREMSGTQDFLFVGTAKAGTTTLYHHISQHPDIEIPVKETFFYLKDRYKKNTLPYPQQRPAEELILDESKFLSLYSNKNGKKQGEVGTGYLYHHEECIPLIKKYAGDDMKILIILRHPTDRCYSSYKHFAKDLHETCSFEESLDREAHRISESWDFMWHHRAMSEYGGQVEAYMSEFKNVKVIIYEEYIRNTEIITKEVYEFIGVDSDFKASNEKRYNTSGEPRFKTLQRLVTQENKVKATLRPAFRLFFSKEKRERIRKGVKNKNLKKSHPISEKMRDELDVYFEKDIKKLEEIIGRKIEAWKR